MNFLITPTEHKVISINFKPVSKKSNPNEDNVDLVYEVVHYAQNINQFGIQFSLNIAKKDDYLADIKYLSMFSSLNPVDENFLDSDLAKINAPAIAFPFLRSFVSFLVLNAGYKPLILGSVNFTLFKKEEINIKLVK